MISKFLSKLKSILFKSAVTPETPLKKEKKAAKSAKTKTKTKTKTKIKTKAVNSKKNIETLTTLPGVGAKSAKALYEAGFKTTNWWNNENMIRPIRLVFAEYQRH